MSTPPAAPRRRSHARRRLLVVVAVSLAVIAAAWLQVEPGERVEHFAGHDVSVIAHAGAQGHAPGNTLPAFELALEQGADTLELDLQLTADHEVVVIHDGTVDRTTDGSGAVRDLTLEQLKELDAGYAFTDADGDHPFRGQGIEIPTLAEVFEAVGETYLILELKTDAGTDLVQPVIELVREHDREGSVAIASFSREYLVPVREQLPGVPTNMPEEESLGFFLRQYVGLHPWWQPPGEFFMTPEYYDTTVFGVDLDRVRVVSPRFVRAAERLGVDVQVWTVNEPEDMHRLLDAGVHGIMTDHPDRLVEVLEQRRRERWAPRGADLSRYEGQLERAARLQEDRGWLTPVWAALTLVGDEEFYVLAFPLLYWTVSRRLGIRLGVVLLVSAGLNALLKLAWASPRPSFLVPELGHVRETSFGMPSGHAQNGLAVWGLLAVTLRRWWAVVGLGALVAGLGWSRIHLGAHFLEDVLVGWVVGGLLLGGFLWLEPRVRGWLARHGPGEQVLLAVASGLTIIAAAALLAGRLRGWILPWPGLEHLGTVAGASPAVTAAATLAGFGAGWVLLRRRGGFDSTGRPSRRVARAVVGLVGLLLLVEGLGGLLPAGEGPLALTGRALRYGLAGAWVGGLAPLLFLRLGLAAPASPTDRRVGDGSSPPARGAPIP